MAYALYKDNSRRTASDKVLRDDAFEIATYLKYDKYQWRFASVVCKCFDKISSGTTYKGTGIYNAISGTIHKNRQLANELQKPIT